MLEAEVKLALDADAARALHERLAALRARRLGEHVQVDTYFAHPVRDFRATDEALRLRLDDDRLRITYKGPKLDPPRKTREEIELGLDTDIDTASALLTRLGFTSVARVEKRRVEYELPAARKVIVAVDDVQQLGCFCEIEVEARDVVEGREALDESVRRLGLAHLAPIPESYLELLLGRR
jgi:adenylate cyclase class 2